MHTGEMTLQELKEEKDRIEGEIEDRYEEVNRMSVRLFRDATDDVAENLEDLAREIRDLGVDLEDVVDAIEFRLENGEE